MKSKITYILMTIFISIIVASCGSEDNINNEKCFSSTIKNLNGKCSSIQVKSSPNDLKDTRMMKIHYSIISSPKRNIQKEPIVFLVGGPGPSNTIEIDSLIDSGVHLPYLNNGRDIIIMDYRGTGFSEPFPKCNIFNMDACIKSLTKNKIKTSDFTTANIVYDLNKILEKENIKKVILIGFSYGTRVATTMARDYPNKVSSMVLDGFFSIEANGISQANEAILEKLDDISKKYNKDYPSENFKDKINNLYNQIDTNTYKILLINLVPKIAYKKNISLTFQKIFDNPKQEIGYLVNQYSHQYRNTRKIDNEHIFRKNSSLMALSIIMYEEYYFIDKQPSHIFGFKSNVLNALKDFKGGSPIQISTFKKLSPYFTNQPPIKEMEALKSDIPTIIITGGQDIQTPKYWAINAQKHLSKNKHFFFPNGEHTLSLGNANAKKIITKFLDNYENLNELDTIKGDDFEQINL